LSLGHALLADNQYRASRDVLGRLLGRLESLGQPQMDFEVPWLAATADTALGDIPAALRNLRRATRAFGAVSAMAGDNWTRSQRVSGEAGNLADGAAIIRGAVAYGHPDAGLAALELVETWREDTLAGVLRATSTVLPADVQALTARIDALRISGGTIPAAVAGPSEAMPPSAAARVAVQAPSAARTQIDSLVAELRQAVGDGLARRYVPVPVDGDRILADCVDHAILSLTPLAQPSGDGGTSIQGISVWALPGQRPEATFFSLSRSLSEMVQMLASGKVSSSDRERQRFSDVWHKECQHLAEQILPRPMRQWMLDQSISNPTSDASERRLIVCADGILRNLPVVALPVDAARVVADLVPVNRVPLLRLISRQCSHRRAASPPQILGCFDPSLPGSLHEQETLAELHHQGRVRLRVVSDQADLLAELASHDYDALVLSVHGSGSGLDYRFFMGERPLSAASFLGHQVPPLVFASACYSGTDAGSDPTGALAILLTSGAHEVVTGSWALPDKSTWTILSELYQSLAPHGGLAGQLNTAWHRWRSRLLSANPYLWAGLAVTELH
jgi:hypothetical protein